MKCEVNVKCEAMIKEQQAHRKLDNAGTRSHAQVTVCTNINITKTQHKQHNINLHKVAKGLVSLLTSTGEGFIRKS